MPFDNRRHLPKDVKPEQVLRVLDARSGSSERARDPLHLSLQRLWTLCIAFYLGRQSTAPLSPLLDLDPSFFPTDDGYKANHVQRMVLQVVSRLAGQAPSFDFTPKSPDPDDLFGNKVAEAFVDYWGGTLDFRELRQQQAFWNVNTGTSFLYFDWDKLAGQRIETVRNPFDKSIVDASKMQPGMLEFARNQGSVESRNTGNLAGEVLSPFQVTIPRGFRHLEHMPWVIIEREVSLDWVWDRYPDIAPGLTTEDLNTLDENQYWRRLSQLVSASGFTLATAGADQHETLAIRELWIPPSGRFPQGLFARATKNTYLEHGPHPYAAAGIDIGHMPWMRFPIDVSRYAWVPGRFWGMGLVEHLIHPQIDYNRSRTQVIQQRDRLSHAQWLAHKKTKLINTRNEYGDILEWEGNIPPVLQQPPAMSQAHVETMQLSMGDLRSLASIHEVTEGDAPGNVRSGTAVRYLQERDSAASMHPSSSMEGSWTKSMQRVATLTWKFCDLPRMVRIYGEFRQSDVAFFKGSQIGGNVFLRVREGSMMPRSKAEMFELTLNLLQMGGLNAADPDQLELVFDALEFGSAEKFFHERNLDRRRATIENQMFLRPEVDPLTGRPAPFPGVRDDDDHQVHIREHMKLLKSDAFEVMPPIRKLAFEAHVQQHKMAIAEAMMAVQAMQSSGAAGGGAGSPPKPPGKASQPGKSNETPGTVKSGPP